MTIKWVNRVYVSCYNAKSFNSDASCCRLFPFLVFFFYYSRDLARIEATVVEKTKSPKVIVFKKKRRKGYKRTQGINKCLFGAFFFEHD